jgi:hypothetical protein
MANQLDLFHRAPQANLLNDALWSRRQDRRDATLAADAEADDLLLMPLVLALARLAAQRDAAELGAAYSRIAPDNA